MIGILMFLGFILGIGSIAIYFYKRVIVVKQILECLDKLKSFPFVGLRNTSLEEIEKSLKIIIEELKK